MIRVRRQLAAASALMMIGAALLLTDDHGAQRLDVLPQGEYRDHLHTATVNIQAGRNYDDPGDSSAFRHFNEPITRVNSTNTVQSRIIARGGYLQGLALQEVCEGSWAQIRWELASKSLLGTAFGFSDVSKASFYDARLNDACGFWFGNAILMRGAFASTPASGHFSQQGGEARSWLCGRTYFALCTTHITQESARLAQVNEYRAIATFGSAGINTFAAGDFNTRPDDFNSLWAVAWAFDGWLDADNANYQATTDGGAILDYIWRRNPNAWAYDAYISPWVNTDHHWKQGYW